MFKSGNIFAADPPENEYYAAMAAITDGGYYLVTEEGGTKWYVTQKGYLTDDKEDACLFAVSKVSGGALYDLGILLDPENGAHFSNTTLIGNKANLHFGSYRQDESNNRGDWERQVFYLNDEGKYAIRSCNTLYGESSWEDAGRAFWTWEIADPEAEYPIPTPCYSYEPAYVWSLELPEVKNQIFLALNDIYNIYRLQAYDNVDNPIYVNMGTEYGQYADWETWRKFKAELDKLSAILDNFSSEDYDPETDPNCPDLDGVNAWSVQLSSMWQQILASEVPYKIPQDGYYRIITRMRYYTDTPIKDPETGIVHDTRSYVTKAMLASNDLNYPDMAMFGTLKKDRANFVWKLTQHGDSILMQNVGMENYVSSSSIDRFMLTNDESQIAHVMFDYAANDMVDLEDDNRDVRDIFYIRLADQPRHAGRYVHQNGHNRGKDSRRDLEMGFWYETYNYGAIYESDGGTSEWYLEPVSEEEVAELIKSFDNGESAIAEQYHELLTKSEEVYKQAVGRESEIIHITGDQLSSNASDRQEGRHIEYLVDGDPNTFWHSDWHNQVYETHYIQVDFDEPVGGNIGLYVLRRRTENHHVTLMGVLGSNDNSQWDNLGEIQLGNASSGQEYTSNPISLGDKTYRSLRFTILANTDNTIFCHFAEFYPVHVAVFGPSYIADMGFYATYLKKLIEEGESLDDDEITEDMLQELQQAYDAFCAELKNLQDGGSPTYMKQLTDLPALYINTFDGSDITSKYDYKYAKLWRIQDGQTEFVDSLEIRGRGNSTWGVPKKPYRIKFKNKEKFLGKGYANARNWTLLANCVDKTLIRNAVASFIGKSLGQKFVPAASFVDLTLNGVFIGNYQISDHVDIRKHRIDIVEQEEYPTEDSDISGGYFMELGSPAYSQEINFTTNRGVGVGVKSPDEDVIDYSQIKYIRDFMNNVESHIFSTNYKDPELGYRPLLDSLALASWYLTVEYTANCDGLYSIYCYKEQADDHLYMGPIWDYDIAFNNCYRLGEMTNKLMLDYGYSSNERQWFKRMYNDPWFKNLIGRRWHKAVLQEKLVEKTLAFVDSLAAELEESQRFNFMVWPIDQRTWDELQLFSTYQEGIDYLKSFLVDHATYLSSVFPNPDGVEPSEPEPTNPMGVDKDSYYYIYNVGNNHPVDICDGSDLLGTWSMDAERYMTQHWEIRPVTEDYYRFVSRESNLAITDIAEGSDGQYTTGSQLQVQPIDEDDDRQLWRFVQAGENWAIENKETKLAWNNSNSGDKDGHPVISWTNNADNASKPTRQWYIEKADESIVDGIASMWKEDFDYRITMDSSKQIHIRIPHGVKNVQGTIAMYDLNGRMLASGNVTKAVDASTLPSGIYLLKWTVNGHSRSRKVKL